MTLQLEVGKTYRARNGDVVKIVEGDAVDFFDEAGCIYDSKGKFFNGSGEPEPYDLIEEDNFSPIFAALA